MSIVEWIGFIIVVIFVGLGVLQSIWELFTGGSPEKAKNDERLRNFLKSLEIDVEEEKPIPPPKPKKHKPPKPLPKKELAKPTMQHDYHYETQYDRASTYRDAYSIKGIEQLPHGRLLIDKLPTKRDLFIYQVIMNPPKGL